MAIDKKILDWAEREMKNVEEWKAANPGWETTLTPYSEFRAQHRSKSAHAKTNEDQKEPAPQTGDTEN